MFTGEVEELRRSHFLQRINVMNEVSELLSQVESSSAEFLSSLEDGIRKIQVPINVRCRACEYRLSPNFAESDGRESKNGFVECWDELADVDPHILDYYHVSNIGGAKTPLANSLIARRRVRLSDVEEKDLVGANGLPTKINSRQRIQRKYTLENAEYLKSEPCPRPSGTEIPVKLYRFRDLKCSSPVPCQNAPLRTSCVSMELSHDSRGRWPIGAQRLD